jgi:hypothetical protein
MRLIQVLRGPDDPEIPRLADLYTKYFCGKEYQAAQWLMDNATTPSIRQALQYFQKMIKDQLKRDFELELDSEASDSGGVTVTAKLGPNIFVWTVYPDKKKYFPRNELTEGMMARLQNAED